VLRVAVLASGNGTNFQALQDACAVGYLDAEIACVITNKADAVVLERAARAGVEGIFVDHKGLTREQRDEIFLAHYEERGVDFACHAGYMRILGRPYCKAMEGRAFNVHPSLLPAFAGAHPMEDAWEHGVKTSGVTIHFVTEELDAGPIVLQRAVEITPDDTFESFEHKMHLVEYAIFPKALKLYAEGALRTEGRRVLIDRDVEEVPWAGELPPGLRG
jgi:phosphoribosylglycinamide formyltransferase-1